MSGRSWLAPLVAGATAALLVVPALRAAPAPAPGPAPTVACRSAADRGGVLACDPNG